MTRALALALAALILASCAAYSLVPANSRVTLANGMSLQPSRAWNRIDAVTEPNLKMWTMDGPMLNVLGLVAGLENNASILKTPSGKEPMPVFRSAMGAAEVAELLEATMTRAAAQGAIVKTSNLRPASFGGRPGFRFDFTYVNQGDDVERRGVAAGAVHGGRLYLVFFHGARLNYFPRNAEEVEALIGSVQIS